MNILLIPIVKRHNIYYYDPSIKLKIMCFIINIYFMVKYNEPYWPLHSYNIRINCTHTVEPVDDDDNNNNNSNNAQH